MMNAKRNSENKKSKSLSSSRRQAALRKIETEIIETMQHHQSKNEMEQRLELQQHESPLSCERSYDGTFFTSSETTVDGIESSDARSIVSRYAMSSHRQSHGTRDSLSPEVVQHSRIGQSAISEKKLFHFVPTNMKQSIFGRAVARQHKRCFSKRKTNCNSSCSRSAVSSSATTSSKNGTDKLGDSVPHYHALSASQVAEAIARKMEENLEQGGDDQDLEHSLQLSRTLNFTDASLLLPPLLVEQGSHKTSSSVVNDLGGGKKIYLSSCSLRGKEFTEEEDPKQDGKVRPNSDARYLSFVQSLRQNETRAAVA
jgi:hypothetical protein